VERDVRRLKRKRRIARARKSEWRDIGEVYAAASGMARRETVEKVTGLGPQHTPR
jgi:hypothetical protein